ncbi:sodium:proton exchanger [Nostoc linckia z18]|uniref:Sodium:proton exchanger n=2 Tax=Nostoc linckia TaxID=92942 RepID=A0A9Q5Z8K2_NOSLI|nr:sodium:proton antiporter [Nostoc linckia]PHK35518.1 sodium:proton exchanger [Nostoc linckia z15]PHK45295.1 sodium:proton exchanger [Nostoc linckia z16]PHJ60342.1 sodium:proton exchanger [Nostoc linckia z1]PHJ67178.1 sodium:proton exchanger [Nostoc linckia z2]PHJ68170.1 sodium:proton exchanger [Nostoc linckia z3]
MVDIYIIDLFVIGLLLLIVTLGSGWISRLPLSFAIIYLLVGIFLGPYGFGLIQLRQEEVFNAELLKKITEIVVIISVFSCGLRIVRPLKLEIWGITARLIGLLMPISIFTLAAVGKLFLGMSWGEAILLGAILAPTDPVLASEVQLTDVKDKDELRFGLTSEGGLNDALAFPFVYFGIYALKDEAWGNWFKQWILVDVIWAIAAGIVMGFVVAKAVVWLDQKIQKRRQVDELMEDFVAIAIILLTYSLTEIVNGYGFLAVFVAGLVVQRSYLNPDKPLNQLEFIERMEKLLEVGTILILGSILLVKPMLNYAAQSLLVIFLLFVIIRPLGVWISTIGKRPLYSHRRTLNPETRLLFGWFGIRGVGSLYYLAYAFGKGLEGEVAEQISWITYTTIVISVIVHGISATPLMQWYEKRIAKYAKPTPPDTIDEFE